MAQAEEGNTNLDAARKQVDEVQNIMKQNVEKVLERDGKLSHLEQRADRLQVNIPTSFTKKVQRLIQLRSCKYKSLASAV